MRPVRSALALALAVVGLLATGCGAETSGRADASDAQYRALLQQIQGTPTQQNAAAFVRHDTYQSGVKACLDDNGFAYRKRPFLAPQADGVVRLGVGSVWLEPPSPDFDLAATKVAYRSVSEPMEDSPYLGLDAAQRRAYDQALNRCLDHEEEWVVGWLPSGAERVRAALALELETIEGDLDTSGYPACLEGWDLPAATPAQLQDLVFTALGPTSSAPARIDGGDQQWMEGVAFERDAAAADAACRADIYAAGLARINQMLPAFQERWADEIDGLTAGWESMVADAAKGGWSGG